MAIPLATTTITVLRSNQDGTKDAGEVTYSAVTSGIRAVIGGQSGTEIVGGGSSEQVTARLVCDPTDLRHDDRILDDSLGDVWEVSWTRRRIGLGLDHTVATLLSVTDRASV